MKKIFTLILLAAGVSLSASAQYRNDGYNNQNSYGYNQPNQNSYGYNQPNQNGNYGQPQQSNDYGYNDRGYNDRGYNDRGYNDRGYNDRGYNRRQRNNDYQRQAEYDRMNQECDRQEQVYRNDRSMNSWERERRIQQVERERQQKANSFGKGLVVGGIAAIVLGAILSGGH